MNLRTATARVAGAAALAGALALPALAAPGIQAKPWVYDPDHTGVPQSQWVTHGGLKDSGNSSHALYLTKQGPTGANAAGGAAIDFTGALSSLGFDYRNDGHCGAGAPRFNVYTTSGTYYFFGCTYGAHTTSTENPDWTRVTFADGDAFPADGTTAWPGFGSVQVTGIDVVYDEGTDVGPGFVYLDNLNVNGTYIGKPGLTK